MGWGDKMDKLIKNKMHEIREKLKELNNTNMTEAERMAKLANMPLSDAMILVNRSRKLHEKKLD